MAALSTSAVRRDAAASYESPFKGESKASNIPDFGHYMSKNAGNANLLFQYFMVGTMGAIAAAGAKSTVQGGWTLSRRTGAPQLPDEAGWGGGGETDYGHLAG